MGATDIALHHLGRIFLARVDGQAGAELARQLQLGVVDIHRDDVQAHGPRVLHGDVAEAADTGDRHPLAGARPGFLEALVHRHAGAKDRRNFQKIDVFRQDTDVVRISQHVFGVATVDRITGVLLALAQGFPAGQAVLAAAAGGVEPGHADTVAFLDPRDAAADRRHVANALVAGNERQTRFHRPVTLGGVQVGVTDARGLDFHQNLPGAGQWGVHLLDTQRLPEGVDDGGFHGLVHVLFLLHASGASVCARSPCRHCSRARFSWFSRSATPCMTNGHVQCAPALALRYTARPSAGSTGQRIMTSHAGPPAWLVGF